MGPAAAGFIIEWIDIGPALYLNAAGYLLATACVSVTGTIQARWIPAFAGMTVVAATTAMSMASFPPSRA